MSQCTLLKHVYYSKLLLHKRETVSVFFFNHAVDFVPPFPFIKIKNVWGSLFIQALIKIRGIVILCIIGTPTSKMK